MPYRILKQFIPTGQSGDPPWARRRIYVQRVTSGSYTGSNELYDDLQSVLLAQDQMIVDDQADYQGWGVYGNGRLFLKVSTDISGNIYDQVTEEKIEYEEEYIKTKKAPPSFAWFTPSGSIGAPVTISGSNLFGVYRIDFNKQPQYEFSNPTNQLIYTTVPTGAISGQLKLFKYDNTTKKSSINFIVTGEPVPSPTITYFTPTSGSAGDEISMFGTNLDIVTRVTFNGTDVPADDFDYVSSTEMYARVPDGASGTGKIIVYNADNISYISDDDFTVSTPTGLTISSFTPLYGIPTTIVTVNGSFFLGAIDVAFNGTSSAFTVLSDSQLTASVPVGSSTGKISVEDSSSNIAYSSIDFVVQKGVSAKVPTIDSFSPDSGPTGSTVNIVGKEFIGTIYVQFSGSYASFYVIDDKHIDAIVPDDAQTGLITVTNNVGSTDTKDPFTVTGQPTPPTPPTASQSASIDSFYPASGIVGSIVVISGSGFNSASEVGFGATTTTRFGIIDDNTIKVNVPSGSTTDVISINSAVTSSTTFTVTGVGTATKIPDVSSFSPSSGSVGTAITASGKEFNGVYKIDFAPGVPILYFSGSGDTELSFVVPSGSVTGRFTLHNDIGENDAKSDFTVT